VLARYQAFCNVIWDTAKESYLRSGEYIRGRMAIVRQHDGYRRLLTVHDANTPHDPRSAWSSRHYDPAKNLADMLTDFKADQIHADWYQDALTNYRAAQRPYVNIEYGYEQGVERLATYNVMQDAETVLRRTWLVTMGGGYPNYYYSNTAWNLFVPEPEPPGYAYHRRYLDFWQGTTWWLLSPDNAPLSLAQGQSAWCRYSKGQEYVVWDDAGAGFELDVKGVEGELLATWFNPLTGEERPAGPLHNGTHKLYAPWGPGHWAVLHAVAADAAAAHVAA